MVLTSKRGKLSANKRKADSLRASEARRRSSVLHSAGSRHAGGLSISPETKPTMLMRSTASECLFISSLFPVLPTAPGSGPAYHWSLSCPSPGEFPFWQPHRGYNFNGPSGAGWAGVWLACAGLHPSAQSRTRPPSRFPCRSGLCSA